MRASKWSLILLVLLTGATVSMRAQDWNELYWKIFEEKQYDNVFIKSFQTDSAWGHEVFSENFLHTRLKNNSWRYRRNGYIVHKYNHHYFFDRDYGLFALVDSFKGDNYEIPSAKRHCKLNDKHQVEYAVTYYPKDDSVSTETYHYDTMGRLDKYSWTHHSVDTANNKYSKTKFQYNQKGLWSQSAEEFYKGNSSKPTEAQTITYNYNSEDLPETLFLVTYDSHSNSTYYYKCYYTYERKKVRKNNSEAAHR